MDLTSKRPAWLIAVVALAATASAQFPRLISDFEDPNWTPFITEVMFRNPSLSGSTTGLDPNVGDLTFLTDVTAGDTFSVVHSGNRASAVTWGWLDPGFHTSWIRLVTFNTDKLPNPALHLQGKVRMWIAATAYTDATFSTPVAGGNLQLGLGIRETGQGVHQGGDGGISGDVEWVGLSAKLVEILAGSDGICDTVADPNSDDVQVNPPGSNIGPDGVCVSAGPDGILQTAAGGDDTIATTPVGAAGIPSDGVMRLYEFDLATGAVSINGTPVGGAIFAFSGDGVLGATPNNRGTLDHLVLTNDPVNGSASAKVWLVNIDDVEFEAPILDPPTIVTQPTPPRPLDEQVLVTDILPGANPLEIFRLKPGGGEVLIASVDPAGADQMLVPTTPLPANVSIVARQTVGADTSDNSTPAVVAPAGNGPLRIAMAIRETDAADHNLACGDDGTGFDPSNPSTLEFIGASGTDGFGVPNAPRFTPQRDWFQIIFNPCDPDFGVVAFSGNGMIDLNPPPDFTNGVWEGLYFRIDELNPTTGPFTIYIDDMVVINGAGPGVDCVIDDFESYTPGDFIVGDFGGNGIADTIADPNSDDIQIVPPFSPVFPGQIIVDPGPDRILQTQPQGDDGVSPLHARFNAPGVAGTSVGLADTPDVARITDEDAFSGTNSLKIEFAFVDASNLRSVLRLTTNGSLATNPPETFLNPDPVVPLSLDGTLCDGSGDILYSVMIKLAPPAISGDCDGDGDVDLLDAACLQQCIGTGGPVPPGCATFDIAPNGAPDDQVDFTDFDLFRYLWVGPAQ